MADLTHESFHNGCGWCTRLDQLCLLAVAHPVLKRVYKGRWVRGGRGTLIYFKNRFRFGYSHGRTCWIRNTEAVIWHSCTLGESGRSSAGVGHSCTRGSWMVIFSLCGGRAAGRKWGRGDVLKLVVQHSHCLRNGHTAEWGKKNINWKFLEGVELKFSTATRQITSSCNPVIETVCYQKSIFLIKHAGTLNRKQIRGK